MADFAGEKTEQATPRRKQDARKKGTVAKSVDLTNALVIFGILLALPFIAAGLGSAMMQSVTTGIGNIPTSVSPSEISRYFWTIGRPSFLAFAPLVLIAMVVGVAANFAQVGFVLSGEALSPSLSKINPFAGFKRLFSARTTVEGIKATVKSLLFGYLAYGVLMAHWDELMKLSWTTPAASLSLTGEILRQIFLRIATSWLVLAAFDYLFQRWQVDKQLKMTKDELKQEFRQNEQSPELRAAIAQKRRRLLRGRMANAVKTADVIITNPTHFSIAIKYEQGQMHAPQVVAKGADVLAFKIRELAKDSRIPIVPNAPLARQLYKRCEVGDFVPRELFQAVAEVLAYVYATLKQVRK